MAQTAQDMYLDWLRGAHTMEKQALIQIDAQLPRMDDYPEMKARLQQHRLETEAQLYQVERILADHDTSASLLKDIAGSAMAGSQALGGMFMTDQAIKGAQITFTFEKFEIATYRTLIASAEHCRDTAAVPVLERILEEEMAMADWVEEHLDQMTRRFLSLSTAEADEVMSPVRAGMQGGRL